MIYIVRNLAPGGETMPSVPHTSAAARQLKSSTSSPRGHPGISCETWDRVSRAGLARERQTYYNMSCELQLGGKQVNEYTYHSMWWPCSYKHWRVYCMRRLQLALCGGDGVYIAQTLYLHSGWLPLATCMSVVQMFD